MRISGRFYRILAASSIIFLGAWTLPTFQRPIPVEVDNTAAQSKAPSTVIDANGNALAIWSKVDAANADATLFQASRYSVVTRRWGAAVTIDAGDISPSAEISGFVGDPKGNAIALFGTLSRGNDRSLMVIRYIATARGGSWQKPRRIDVEGLGFSLWERIVADASGNAVVVWGRIDGSSGKTRIFASRYEAATDAWGAPVDISLPQDENAPDDAFGPELAINARGTAFVVFSSPAGDLVSRRFNIASGRWEQPVSIPEVTLRELRAGTTTAPFALLPSIGVDARGNAIVAWSAFRSDTDPSAGGEIRSNRYDAATGKWNDAALVASDPRKQDVAAFTPRIAVDASGNAAVAWVESSIVRFADVIVANNFSAISGRWGQPATLADRSNSSPDMAELSSGQSIAVDAAGNALLVWSQLLFNPESSDESTRSNITASRYVAATRSWTTPLRLNDGFSKLGADAADLAVAARGDAMVVWRQGINREVPQVSRIFSNPAIGR